MILYPVENIIEIQCSVFLDSTILHAAYGFLIHRFNIACEVHNCKFTIIRANLQLYTPYTLPKKIQKCVIELYPESKLPFFFYYTRHNYKNNNFCRLFVRLD